MSNLNDEVVQLVSEFAEDYRAGRVGADGLAEYAARARTAENRAEVLSLGQTAILVDNLFKANLDGGAATLRPVRPAAGLHASRQVH